MSAPAPSPTIHPVIVRLVELINTEGLAFQDVARAAGIPANDILRWLRDDSARQCLGDVDAVAATLGHKIIVVPAWFDLATFTDRLRQAETKATLTVAPAGMRATSAAAWLRNRGWSCTPPPFPGAAAAENGK